MQVKDNVYNLFIRKFAERNANADSERRAAAFLDGMVGLADKQQRRREGLLPDVLLEMALLSRIRLSIKISLCI